MFSLRKAQVLVVNSSGDKTSCTCAVVLTVVHSAYVVTVMDVLAET